LLALGGSTLAFFLSWQFSQFILLLQLAALFATQILGYFSAKTYITICRVYFFALLANIILSLGLLIESDER
jgi:hypothetical protein